MTFAKGVGPDGVAPPNSSGITVIIVGMGLGGLACAIECTRKGHKVIAYDQAPELKPIGDSISIAANAARVVKKWGHGSVDRELQPLISQVDDMTICNSAGVELLTQSLSGYGEGDGYPAHRGDLAMAFYRHALELGVEFRLGYRVSEYFEEDEKAGIVVNGERVTADCVIGADGVHSTARGPVTGTNPEPHSSGYAVYRAWFDATEVAEDPETCWLIDLAKKKGMDIGHVWIGPDCHCMFGTSKMFKEVFWMCTHKDIYDVTESWSFPGYVDDFVKYIEDWEIRPKLEAIARKTPPDRLIDYKLLWRDPLPTWTSPKGRMIIIGDAAHPYLPTSGQGAGQAIEDAATLAITLELAGKDQVPLALRTMQTLRYARTSKIQHMGIETREVWHKTDWEAIAKDTKRLEMPRPEWIFGHDCQKYAYDEFAIAAESVFTGKEYEAKNTLEDGVDHRQSDFDTSKYRSMVQGMRLAQLAKSKSPEQEPSVGIAPENSFLQTV